MLLGEKQIQINKESEGESRSVLSDSLWPHGLYNPWNSPGQNTGVGSLSLLSGIEPRFPAPWVDSLPVKPQGKPEKTHHLTQITLVSPKTWRRKRHPTPVLLPGKSHGWRSLVGYSPWGREELDRAEQLHFHFSLSCIGEGNGNPLQCSCLENPRDGGAWRADVCGVTYSRTRLSDLAAAPAAAALRRCIV